ncbi:hypothetical protein FA95DRAFT_1502737 [Auriscalpium vulgare]|uniref:Uncharacterized protein n=1 Tax=Auriscalpium vulgare TaxID=40419 RepID=A0ACB8R942_9AGAM|nr:hypothetical protein FA95DRAFT_1502737 [Auriscalpium vulgare]
MQQSDDEDGGDYPHSPPAANGQPGVHTFLVEAHKISVEANFIIQSLPNVETPAVERICLQLEAIRRVLTNLDDPSVHNVRIERLWRDVRKGTVESYRQVFFHLEECGLLNMEDPAHRACLILVFLPRIQESLNRTMDAWNHHSIRTAQHRTPLALYELSREKALRGGYWTGDPGDPPEDASDPLYGVDFDAPMPPADEVRDEEHEAGFAAEGDTEQDDIGEDNEELTDAQDLLSDIDLQADDQKWGIDTYCEAVLLLQARMRT